MDLSSIRSDFIRQKLAEGSLDDHSFRNYIEKLMKLESIITNGGPQSFLEGIDFYFLRTTHAKEYSILLRELQPAHNGVSKRRG